MRSVALAMAQKAHLQLQPSQSDLDIAFYSRADDSLIRVSLEERLK
jgi:hypothetical protein